MLNTIFGEKIGQTQKFLVDGTRIPVTLIKVASNVVANQKTKEKDGYTALQIAVGKKQKANKALFGHVKKAGVNFTPLYLKEVRMENEELLSVGSSLDPKDVFEEGDIVQVTGVSKGKGFAGGVKRYGFRGGPRTHGQSDRERAPGSIGQTTTPGRVYKGKRMAGRMGNAKVTIKNLTVLWVDQEKSALWVKGLVPGVRGAFLTVRKTGKIPEKKYIPLFGIQKEEKIEEGENHAS